MERELWPGLYHAVREVGERVHQQGQRYQPWVLVLTYLWAALHDRPVKWACKACHWSTTRLKPLQIPSSSTMSRRVYKVAMGVFWRLLEEHLRAAGTPGLLSFADGKPLLVGHSSKDRDARWGRVQGGMGKGYKLHEILGNQGVIASWTVTPLNAAESVVAQTLVSQISAGGYILADGNYDSGALHAAAAARGYQLLTPCESPQAGKGHRRCDPSRLRSITAVQTPFGAELLSQRIRIEQHFGHLTSFAGGLGPLPAWVRRAWRVRTWVWAKLHINAVRQRRKNQQLTA